MNRTGRLAFAAILLFVFCRPAVYGSVTVEYDVSPNPPGNNVAASTSVIVTVKGLKEETSIRVQMPVWSPGDYHVMNHAQYVKDLSAVSGKTDLAVEHPDANTWAVATKGAESVTIKYSLPNTPPGLFSENICVKESYAFYNGPALYVYVVDHKDAPAVLRVHLPEGWEKAVSPLEPAAANDANPRTPSFTAPDYDTLADSPLLAGDCVTREFTSADRLHTVAFFGLHRGTDYDAFVPMLKSITEAECKYMGCAPFKRYVFFFDVAGRGGGLEHLNSCRIAIPQGMTLRSFAPFVAHEYFHLWNVKRIRPFVLGPFDYINPPKTRNLWFVEGITEYCAYHCVLLSGLRNASKYLDGCASGIATLLNMPARKRVTADESSLRVWEADNSSGYGGLSYYTKGEMMGICFDLKLLSATNGKVGLENVMQNLLDQYGLPKPGYPEDGIRDALIKAGGAEMGPFYDKLARSVEELPLAECLGYAGCKMENDVFGCTITEDANPSAAQLAVRKSWLSWNK